MATSKKKVWKILNDTYVPKKKPITVYDVERLIAAMQQEIYWDQRDIDTYDEIMAGKIDWTGNVITKK